MCGIAGWLGPVPDAPRIAETMLARLRHRGPDASDRRVWSDATLLHTRLSILDLSPAGREPLGNEDGTVWIVFNGELYNHQELRRDLESRGHVFRGRADAEVLPHLYEEEGADFVRRLRGMFAFALYDVKANRMLLVRDRFGIKPLFYVPGRERLAFASEINALRCLPDVDLTPDPQAISDFAALFFVPSPLTFYKGIRSLEPGTVLEARRDRGTTTWKTWRYHRWSIAPDPSITLEQAGEQANGLLVSAVQGQLESDVPLGALLSGGIDSSLVSAAARSQLGQDLQTFNVRFADAQFDETPAALAVARRIGSQHRMIESQPDGGHWEAITGLLRHLGQPFGDTSVFAANAICREMRKHVTVALSGDGGDEAFGGYNLFRQLSAIDRWQAIPAAFWRAGARALTPLARLGVVRTSLSQRAADLAGAEDGALVQMLCSWIRPLEHEKLCRTNGVQPVRRLFDRQWEHHLPARSDRRERLSALATEVGLRLTLPDDYLFKVDAASMREGLEVRVPLLDEELVAFGLTLPHRLKVGGRTTKRVLRDVARRWLPPDVVTKTKHGFGIPVDTWVDPAFRERFREVILGPSSRLPNFFRPETYRPWAEAFSNRMRVDGISREGLYQRAIMLLSVELALEPRGV